METSQHTTNIHTTGTVCDSAHYNMLIIFEEAQSDPTTRCKIPFRHLNFNMLLLIRKIRNSCSDGRRIKVSDSAIFRYTPIVVDTELVRSVAPPPVVPPLPPPHATQVAGGLGLSLTAANYRLTRPRCALHDCISTRSGYPERGRDGE